MYSLPGSPLASHAAHKEHLLTVAPCYLALVVSVLSRECCAALA